MPYASKYYDPQKAHEYYMRTRELKGYEDRYGGSRGDGTSYASSGKIYQGKTAKAKEEAAAKVKAHNTNIDNQLKSLHDNTSDVDRLKVEMAKNKNEVRSRINEINSKIKELQSQYNGMSKEDKKAYRYEIQDAIADYRNQIKQIRRDYQDGSSSIRDQIHSAKLSKKDTAQELKMQKKGGSTSGFNEKGKKAAAYIKDQMERERDDLIVKTNKDLDDEMLGKAKHLESDIRNIRKNGGTFNNKEMLSRLKALVGETKKTKDRRKRKNVSEYKQKYKDEIDKLRQDKSMYTYYDRREESEAKYKAQQKARKEAIEQRRAEQDAAAEERERKKQERRAQQRAKAEERERKRQERLARRSS